MAGQTQQFELNEEPHQAAVGSQVFMFKPEVYSDELLDAWAEFRAVTLKKDEPGDDAAKIAARSREVNDATKAFLSELMLGDDDLATYRARDDAVENAVGATTFLETKLPDRVLLELQRWILGVYGLRPTGPSSGSSVPSPTETPGGASTGSGPNAE